MGCGCNNNCLIWIILICILCGNSGGLFSGNGCNGGCGGSMFRSNDCGC